MVDKFLLASKIAAVRDAVARIREMLPADSHTFAFCDELARRAG